MSTYPMWRLTTVAVTLAGFALPGALLAQSAGGGAPARPAQVRVRALTAVEEAELSRELARARAERMHLESRILTLAAHLDSSSRIGAADRRRLQMELEENMRRLTETHARVGLDVGSRIVLDRSTSVASQEVRRTLVEAQRRLSSAARMGYVGITLSPTNNHVRAEGSGELYVRYFERPTIISVEPNSPAERAGLQRGDVVLAYDGVDVRRELPMHDLLEPGRRLTIRVGRAGRDHDVALTVADPPANVRGRRTDFLASPGELERRVYAPSVRGATGGGMPAATAARASGVREGTIVMRTPAAEGRTVYRFELARGIAGAELTPISGGLRDALGVRQGLLVMRVAPQSVAARAGLRDGDIIVKAGGRAIEDIPGLSRAMRENDDARTLALETVRARKKRMVRLTW